MPEHFLQRMQIRTVFQQMCSKAVAQCVRRDILVNLRFPY